MNELLLQAQKIYKPNKNKLQNQNKDIFIEEKGINLKSCFYKVYSNNF